jgi:hypothetical protein
MDYMAYDGMEWMAFVVTVMNNRPSGSMRSKEFLDHLSNCKTLRGSEELTVHSNVRK